MFYLYLFYTPDPNDPYISSHYFNMSALASSSIPASVTSSTASKLSPSTTAVTSSLSTSHVPSLPTSSHSSLPTSSSSKSGPTLPITNAQDSSSNSNTLSTGAKVGIAIGTVGLVAISGFLGAIILTNRRKNKSPLHTMTTLQQSDFSYEDRDWRKANMSPLKHLSPVEMGDFQSPVEIDHNTSPVELSGL